MECICGIWGKFYDKNLRRLDFPFYSGLRNTRLSCTLHSKGGEFLLKSRKVWAALYYREDLLSMGGTRKGKRWFAHFMNFEDKKMNMSNKDFIKLVLYVLYFCSSSYGTNLQYDTDILMC